MVRFVTHRNLMLDLRARPTTESLTPSQVRAARALLDISQQDLADLSKVGLRTIVQFERGSTSISASIIRALALSLGNAGIEFIPENGDGAGLTGNRGPQGLAVAAMPMTSNHVETLRYMAIAGHGIAWLPDFSVRDALASGTLRVSAIYPLVARGVGLGLMPVHPLQAPQPGFAMYPVSLVSPPERLALIYPRGRRLLPAVHRAMELCRAHLRVH